MSSRSLRSITVEHQQFRWKFDDQLVVLPAGRSAPQLIIDWNWRDWLEPEGAGPEPRVVTPKFVAAAIRFALANGWQPDQSRAPLRVNFFDGRFVVWEGDSPSSHSPEE